MVMTDPDLEKELDALLSETVDQAQRREANAFDELARPGAPLVLFGAGNLGRRTLAGLRTLGMEPLCFIDSNQSRWGQVVDGLRLVGPEEAARLHGEEATFIITIWGALASDRMAHRVQKLQDLGCRNVITFVPLYWKYPKTFLPHYTLDLPHRVLLEADDVRSAFALLSDERSKSEFLAQLRFRLYGDFDALSSPVDGPIYFRRDLFTLGPQENLVDCGAFDGDTLALFLDVSAGSFQSVIAIEPDPGNFQKMSQSVSALPADIRDRIQLHPCATGSVYERVRMEIGSGPASHLGSGECEVECFPLDTLLHGAPASIIKMDIEGSEIATLSGAKQCILHHAPVLTISAYHRQSDLWNIPLTIHSMQSDYLYYLRPHMIEAWDLVCYAVPPSRQAVPPPSVP